MCGIAGYLGEQRLEPETLQTCLQLMSRRGPDHADYRHFVTPSGRHLYLLHSRLSIIDLDPRANQPFRVGSQWLVYNGELYNYLELRDQLANRGEGFRTQSDTEVLLRAIIREGWEVLDQLEGMWAFALYDEHHGTLSLSRDRFGEKPLFILRDHTGLYFGSEVKFIFALFGRRLEVNYQHLYRYLVNGYKSLYKSGHTFFRELLEVQPATTLHLADNGAERVDRYWEPDLATNEDMTYEEAVSGTRKHLIRSVDLRLRADVPLSFCMSGGIDSNSLIGIAKRVLDYDVHGLTVVNEDKRYDEWNLVECTTKELGIRHTSIPVDTRDFLPRLRELVRYHDAPVYTITYYAHWLLMETVAKHGYRISVSGSAADELFTGYYDHHLAFLYEIRDDPKRLADARKAWGRHILPIVRNPYLQDPELFFNDPGFRDHIYLDAPNFADYLTRPWLEPFHERHYVGSLLRNRMLNEIFHEAVPVILHEDDLNAMYYSIENRSPFLDRRLFEFAYSVPAQHLIQDGRTKAILRDAMSGIVPQAVLDNRRKVGFNAPIHSFLNVKDAEVRACLLADSPIFDHVRQDKIAQLVDKEWLPNSESKFLFYFLASKIFLEEFAA